MVRTPACCDKTGLRKGTWTLEEDRKLKAYITKYGCWNWRQLPKYAGLSRCGKSCRLRWMNYLRPNLKRGNFSKEEEQTIIKLHESLGNRWSAIAAQLPGRTDNEIKNHWHTYLKKYASQISISQGDDIAKPSTNHRSKCKSKGPKRSEPKNSSADPSTHQIFESSQFSPPSLSVEYSSLTIDTSPVNSTSFIAESCDVSPSEMFAETSGNFWTEPFLADNYDTTYDDILASIVDLGLLSPQSPVISEEFLLSSFDSYDEYQNIMMW